MNNSPSDQLKPRRSKCREVSSRFLSPNRRHSTKSNSSTNRGKKSHDLKPDGSTKENRWPSLTTDDYDDDSVILPGRFSVDECALYRRNSYSLLYDSHNHESDSESSVVSSASNRSVRTPKPGIQVPSKYLHDLQTRPRKGASDSNNQALAEKSPQRTSNFRNIRNMMYGYGKSKSQWALSPGRSRSPPLSLETKARLFSVSSLKPPHPVGDHPPRGKGVSKLLNLGLDFFKSNKSQSSASSSPLKLKPSDAEAVHWLKLLHNRLLQWRFVNARADSANNNIVIRGNNQLLCVGDILSKLRHSIVQKKIGVQKRKLEMNLYHVLLSQIKHLEAWEAIERQHLSALSMTKQCLLSVVSRLPLTEGAEVDLESTSMVLKQALAITDSIMSSLANFASSVENYVPFISELAEVVAQESLMLEECSDLLRTVSELEIQERSLKCCYIFLHKQMMNKNFKPLA